MLHSGLPALTTSRGDCDAAPSSPYSRQELGLRVSFEAGEALSGVAAEGPQRPLTASGQPLTLKRCRSLSEPSRVCPKLCRRRSRGIPKIAEKLRRARAGRDSLFRARPKLPDLSHDLVFRK